MFFHPATRGVITGVVKTFTEVTACSFLPNRKRSAIFQDGTTSHDSKHQSSPSDLAVPFHHVWFNSFQLDRAYRGFFIGGFSATQGHTCYTFSVHWCLIRPTNTGDPEPRTFASRVHATPCDLVGPSGLLGPVSSGRSRQSQSTSQSVSAPCLRPV